MMGTTRLCFFFALLFERLDFLRAEPISSPTYTLSPLSNSTTARSPEVSTEGGGGKTDSGKTTLPAPRWNLTRRLFLTLGVGIHSETSLEEVEMRPQNSDSSRS